MILDDLKECLGWAIFGVHLECHLEHLVGVFEQTLLVVCVGLNEKFQECLILPLSHFYNITVSVNNHFCSFTRSF